MAFLKADETEAVILAGIVRRADKHVFELQKRQAILIANEVGRVVGRMFK